MDAETLKKAEQLNHYAKALEEYLSKMKELSKDKGKLYDVIFEFSRLESKGCCNTAMTVKMPLTVVQVVGHENIVKFFVYSLTSKIAELRAEIEEL